MEYALLENGKWVSVKKLAREARIKKIKEFLESDRKKQEEYVYFMLKIADWYGYKKLKEYCEKIIKEIEEKQLKK